MIRGEQWRSPYWSKKRAYGMVHFMTSKKGKKGIEFEKRIEQMIKRAKKHA